MSRLWYMDGLSRKQYEEEGKRTNGLKLLESEFPELMGRAIEMMHKIYYFNAENRTDGHFYELFRFEPLVVLVEIFQEDTGLQAKEFISAYEAGRPDIEILLEQLEGKLNAWEKRLVYWQDLQLTFALKSRPRPSAGPSGRKRVKGEYYGLLETIRRIQQNFQSYLEEIEQGGNNDPALSLLYVFLQNYGAITRKFNERWELLPVFYSEQILHTGVRRPIPGKTWVMLRKGKGVADIVVPEGTRFVAGKNEDGSLFYYHSVESMEVGEMKLTRLKSYLLEYDAGRYPASRLGYVTAILRKELTPQGGEMPQVIFGGTDSFFEPVGLVIESPMLWLKEGNRNVVITLRMTKESTFFWLDLVEKVARGRKTTFAEVIFKMLADAFYLEVSTSGGWEKVPDYVLTYEEEGILRLSFRLSSGFPAVLAGPACNLEKPALRILMNREAWLFPYSWARKIRFNRLTIRTEVSGITQLQLYTKAGQQDISMAVYPFGVQPEKGDWLIFGNYEIAQKPLKEVVLCCRWQQLPDHPEGLFGYYRNYNASIDNRSFRVRSEWLEGNRWKTTAANRQYLFDSSPPLQPAGPLPEVSRLCCRDIEYFPALTLRDEADYAYGRIRSGFIRVVLESPEIGFGHKMYRQLFADIMVQNTHRRHPLPLPEEPLTPLADHLELSYAAEEVLDFGPGQDLGHHKLYYLSPWAASHHLTITAEQAVALADGPAEQGYLLFGFGHAVGYQRLSLFIDLVPLQKEIDRRDQEEDNTVPCWYMKGKRKWERLEPEALLKDSTRFFGVSGQIKLLLPYPVAQEMLDEEGLFWLCVTFPSGARNCPAIRGVFMNTVELVAELPQGTGPEVGQKGLPQGTIVASEKNIPGLAEIIQVVPGGGGRPEENPEERQIRMSQRICHRNRALLPGDYEHLVLEHFLEVAKVKCLPAVDTKGRQRSGAVTLVIIPREMNAGWPLANHCLLLEVEEFLKEYTSVFTVVDAINPVYEEMLVRCQITLEQGMMSGEVVRRIERGLNACIAPWLEKDRVPVFGHSFSLQSLQNVILEDPGVVSLRGISLLHITSEGEQNYQLNEYGMQKTRREKIRASKPWCIAVPPKKHLVEVNTDSGWEDCTGLGQLEIGDSFVIN